MTAIYQPKGKAQEYNQWAVNFYNGCSGKCTYCFNRKGRGAKILGADVPTIKKTLIDEKTALKTFERELTKNLIELQKHGLFFNFVSDPFLPETELLNSRAMRICLNYDVPIILLTKQTAWVQPFVNELLKNNTIWNTEPKLHLWSIGFTLTGHDELEPGCCSNKKRIKAIKCLNEVGIRTWASIEPVIDFKSSLDMINKTIGFCNHYKIGLESGKKFNKKELNGFVQTVNYLIQSDHLEHNGNGKIYWKNSVTKHLTNETFNTVMNKSNPVNVSADYKFWKVC